MGHIYIVKLWNTLQLFLYSQMVIQQMAIQKFDTSSDFRYQV